MPKSLFLQKRKIRAAGDFFSKTKWQRSINFLNNIQETIFKRLTFLRRRYFLQYEPVI